MRLPKLFSSTAIIAVLLIILISIGTLQFRQWRKRVAIQREIDAITEQQVAYEQKNRDLENSLNLLNTDNYKEKIAREQLNLQKPGEIVVNLPDELPVSKTEVTTVVIETNGQKWWRYFFDNN